MTAVIDTHVLLWWLSSPASLSPAVVKCFETWASGTGEALVCGVSLWKLEDQRLRGKLALQFPVRKLVTRDCSNPMDEVVGNDSGNLAEGGGTQLEAP